MGGFFGAALKRRCVNDVFYGVDYNSHLGTRRGGMVTYDAEEHRFCRSIHSLESSYFRTKFESELHKYKGNIGIGVISDTDPQPITFNTHLGRYALVTVAKIENLDELEKELIDEGAHFAELSSGTTNPTELIGLLINKGKDFVDGIEHVYRKVKGSCSMLILTEDSVIVGRDKLGRTSIVIGRKEDGYAVSSESTSFPNLDYELLRDVGPGEIVELKPDGIRCLREANKEMQICAFMWVYYGFPTSTYENRNVEEVRFRSGYALGQQDKETEIDCVSGIPDSGVGMALGYAAGPCAAVRADGECRDERLVVGAALRCAGVRLSTFRMCHFYSKFIRQHYPLSLMSGKEEPSTVIVFFLIYYIPSSESDSSAVWFFIIFTISGLHSPAGCTCLSGILSNTVSATSGERSNTVSSSGMTIVSSFSSYSSPYLTVTS